MFNCAICRSRTRPECPNRRPWIVLNPRQEKKLEIVVRTTNVGAAVMLHGEVVGGGTRASVDIADPVAWELTDSGKGDRIPANRVFVDGDTEYRVGIDVRDYVDNPEPETFLGYTYYITKGVMQGLWNITSGLACGIFIGIPTLVGKTIASIPAAVQAYVQAEVELWGAIKDDPVKVALFMNVVTNQTLLAYAQAPQLIGDVQKLEANVQSAVFAHYNEMWTAWYAGDWRTAVTAFSTEGHGTGGRHRHGARSGCARPVPQGRRGVQRAEGGDLRPGHRGPRCARRAVLLGGRGRGRHGRQAQARFRDEQSQPPPALRPHVRGGRVPA